MSVSVPCISCDGGWTTLKQLLKSCIYIDSDGNEYFSIKFTECSGQDSAAVVCGSSPTIEQLFKGTFITDDCGHCSLLVGIDQSSMDLVCDNCTPRK